MLYRYAVQQDAFERGQALDVCRVAHASVISEGGHKLFKSFRKLLDAQADGEESKPTTKAVRKRLRSDLVALGAVVTDKR